MCGIVGFYTKKATAEHVALFHFLARQSIIRGLHSFGMSYIDKNGDIITSKWFKNPNLIQHLKPLINKKAVAIWHNRYSTSGDWHNVENNLPMVVETTTVVMNGVITMAPKEEWGYRFGLECQTENDTELLARTILRNGGMIDWVRSMDMTVAVLYIKNGQIYAFRNNRRPLHWFEWKKAIYVVSTRDIAERVFNDCGEGFERPPVFVVPMFEELKLSNLL